MSLSIKKLGGQSESNLLTQVIDPKERKLQRDIAQRGAMTKEQQNEININSKKRRAKMTEDQWNEVNRKQHEAYREERPNLCSLNKL
jgi:hypothetical protein